MAAAVTDGVDVQADVFLAGGAEQVEHDAEARRAILPFGAAEVGEEVEALLVAQEADGGEEIGARDAERRHILAREVLRGGEAGEEGGGVHVRVG